MAISIKNAEQIQRMRVAGEIVAQTHELLEKSIRPGITTRELNDMADKFIRDKGAEPSFLGYNGYPASICTSVNEEVIHGIPGIKRLKDGDIVSIDIGAYINSYHGDAARTHPVGNVSQEALKLMRVTEESFFLSLEFARAGRRLHEISAAVQRHAESNGFSVVREYVGHGIGTKMHEEPQIPNYSATGRGPRLYPGMVLAIEPMVNTGGCEIKVLGDDWTVVTRDKKYSAHYENTILITDGEPEILTLIKRV